MVIVIPKNYLQFIVHDFKEFSDDLLLNFEQYSKLTLMDRQRLRNLFRRSKSPKMNKDLQKTFQYFQKKNFRYARESDEEKSVHNIDISKGRGDIMYCHRDFTSTDILSDEVLKWQILKLIKALEKNTIVQFSDSESPENPLIEKLEAGFKKLFPEKSD